MAEAVWIFAYGSLLWDPGFVPAETRPARLTGWRRRFCMASIRYRGTPEAPGLVLALDAEAGATCEGLALRPDPQETEAVLTALRARELVSNAYDEVRLPVTDGQGARLLALTYVMNRANAQFVDLPLPAQAEVIARAAGPRGPNADYLHATVAHLRALGVHDPEIEELETRVRALRPQP